MAPLRWASGATFLTPKNHRSSPVGIAVLRRQPGPVVLINRGPRHVPVLRLSGIRGMLGEIEAKLLPSYRSSPRRR
jgi:hypothetical protein